MTDTRPCKGDLAKPFEGMDFQDCLNCCEFKFWGGKCLGQDGYADARIIGISLVSADDA